MNLTFLFCFTSASTVFGLKPVVVPKMGFINNVQYVHLLEISRHNTKLLRFFYSPIVDFHKVMRNAFNPDWEPDLIREFRTSSVRVTRQHISDWDEDRSTTEMVPFLQFQFDSLFHLGGLLESMINRNTVEDASAHMKAVYPAAYVETEFIVPLVEIQSFSDALPYWLSHCRMAMPEIQSSRPKKYKLVK